MTASSLFCRVIRQSLLWQVAAHGFVLAGQDRSVGQADDTVTNSVTPFVTKYCLECHNSDHAEAKLNLSGFLQPEDIGRQHLIWQNVIRRIQAGEMPPTDASIRPTTEQSRAVVEQIQLVLKAEAARHRNDPGLVPVRRLSNAEYNYTIRDLTGVDIRPTREFPVDPANEAGFDNSAESLALSPALLNKYLAAAREVAQYLVLKPQGFDFAPHPVQTDTDRDKYCVNRIVDFYRRQPTQLDHYFSTAWQARMTSQTSPEQLDQLAGSAAISPKYLATVWQTLTDPTLATGPIAQLQELWQAIPIETGSEQRAREVCTSMAEFVQSVRRKLEPPVEGLNLNGIHNGAQAFVLWKNDQYAANRRRYHSAALIDRPPSPPEPRDISALLLPADEAEREKYLAAVAHFASVFPDEFYVSERGRDYLGVPREKQEKGRLLNAGFHSMMGYYRDDAPLCDLILNDEQKRELDSLWQELDFVTSAPMRQYVGFVWFERTDSSFLRGEEFDFARAEDQNVTSEEMIHRLSVKYLEKAERNGGTAEPLQAIRDYFERMNLQIRWVENARMEAEPHHLAALEIFAARCYRRPLTHDDTTELRTFYQRLRTVDGLTHEEAIQDSVVSLLVSPLFFYRTDLAASTPDESVPNSAKGRMPAYQPLNDFELASRLSYFLWSSMPDQQLLEQAATGRLHKPEVLLAQTQRMLQDNRVRALAVESAGQWLGFRRFEEHNSVDRVRFSQFNDDLRSAMYEEPIRFLTDLIQHDGSLLDCLYADHTFVNVTLAKHYGIELPKDIESSARTDGWRRIDGAGQFGRGGLIPMAVFLTQNSPGLRTSPVKRGYWVAKRLLGEHIPPPPPGVPDLPDDESSTGDLTLRDALARHREHASCAGCHNRFDSLGLIFENYGPIGELRNVDLGGRPVQTAATFPDGTEGSTADDLRRYLKQHRETDFIDNFCRKMVSFGLGRSLQLSDELLIDEIRLRLQDDGPRFGLLIEAIVSSPQFRHRQAQNQQVQAVGHPP